jgi:hypothetical protein
MLKTTAYFKNEMCLFKLKLNLHRYVTTVCHGVLGPGQFNAHRNFTM